MEDLDEIAVRLHGPGVDANQHVPRAHTRPGGRRVFGNDAGGQAFTLGTPQHAVLELGPRRPHGDVGHGQAEEYGNDCSLSEQSQPGGTPGVRANQQVGEGGHS